MASIEPAFEIDDNAIYMNLHRSALQKCKLKVRDAKEIINTAVTDDKFGGNDDGTYEFAVIYVQKNYEDPSEGGITGDEHNEMTERNKLDRERLREDALAGALEYFTWFSGKETAKALTKTDLVIIHPAQDHDAKVTDFRIEEISDEEYKEWVDVKHKKPRIGFKMTYQIVAGGEGGEK